MVRLGMVRLGVNHYLRSGYPIAAAGNSGTCFRGDALHRHPLVCHSPITGHRGLAARRRLRGAARIGRGHGDRLLARRAGSSLGMAMGRLGFWRGRCWIIPWGRVGALFGWRRGGLAVHIDAGHNPDHACAGSQIGPVAKEAGVMGTSLVWPRRCQFPGRGLSGTSKRQPRKRQQRGDESSFGHSDPHSWQTTLCGRVQIYVVSN